jgi:uncharacterized membrane protein
LKIDGKRVRAAIAAAEEGTTARIGVHVSEKDVRSALEHAEERFQHAQMHKHPAGNAVLILVAPKSRKVAVYGGPAAHERLGDAFWNSVVDEMTPLFAQDRPTDALVRGIEHLGAALRKQFPAEPHS